MLEKIGNEFDKALFRIKAGKLSYADALVKIGGIVYGWSCHYWFCDDMQYFFDFDRDLDQLWGRFQKNYLVYTAQLRKDLIGKSKNIDLEIRMREGIDSVARVVEAQREKLGKRKPRISDLD